MKYTDNVDRRSFLKAAGATAAVGFAGCTGPEQTETEEHHDDGHGHDDDDDHGHGGGYDEPVEHAEVEMYSTEDGDHHFDPHVVWLKPGGSIEWVNKSGSHTTTGYHPDNDTVQRVPDGGETWDSGYLTEEGATYEHTFEEEGVYDYVCTPHEAAGMVSTVLVGEPDQHGQPGLEEPQDELPGEARHQLEELNQQVNEMLGHGH